MRKRLNLTATAAIISVILYYSLVPQPAGPGGGSISFSLLHFMAYFSLAGALLLHFHDTPRGHIKAASTAFIFGFLMEILQLYVPTRYFTFQDIAVNLAGSSLVMLDHRSRYVTDFIRLEDEILESIQRRLTAF